MPAPVRTRGCCGRSCPRRRGAPPRPRRPRPPTTRASSGHAARPPARARRSRSASSGGQRGRALVHPVPARLLEHAERRGRPGAAHPGREAVVEALDPLGLLELERVRGIGHRPVPGPGTSRSSSRSARTYRRRCPPARTATSGPSRRRSRSRARARPPAPPRAPARRRAARARRSRRARARRRPAAHPRHVRARNQPRRARHLAGELGERHDADLDPMAPAGPAERREQARVLLVGGQDLVAGAEIEPGDHGVDAVGRRAGQRDLGRLAAERARRTPARACAASPMSASKYGRPHRPDSASASIRRWTASAGGARHRTLGAGVEVREPLEHRELGAEGGRVGGGGRGFVHTHILSSRMCFDFDARPPAPPEDLLLAPIAGGAGAECSSSPRPTARISLRRSPERRRPWRRVPDLPRRPRPVSVLLGAGRAVRAGRLPRDRDGLLRPDRGPRPTRRGVRVHAARPAADGPGRPAGRGRRDRRARASARGARSPPSGSASAGSSHSSPAPTCPSWRPSSASTACSPARASASTARSSAPATSRRRCSGCSVARTRQSRSSRSRSSTRS